MELSSQIKKYRTERGLSQEELAERVYVTRQTVSNWENEKSYPDIHSLLLLSSFFQVSLDQLIKGDIEIMKKEINTAEIQKFNRYGAIFTVLMIATWLSIIPVLLLPTIYVLLPAVVLYVVTFLFSLKVERLKRDNDIQTFQEIVAFTEGQTLDEMAKQREIGKRPYQAVLAAVVSAGITIILGLIVTRLFL